MSTTVISPAQPEQVLKGLGKLWTSLGEEEKQQGKPTVLRACAMTLIVASDERDAVEASQAISELMKEHPSRGIVLSVSQEGRGASEARVLAQCWKPFGKAQQICCEQIEIATDAESWRHIGPFVTALTVADLPVVYWCKHSGALNPAAADNIREGFQSLLDLSTKTVIDSAGFDAADAYGRLTAYRGKGHVVADLEWTRLTFWREPIGHIFDNPAREHKFSEFHSVDIAYTDESPSLGVLYLGAWLSAPNKAKVSFNRVQGYGPGVHSITLRCDGETIVFEREAKECAHMHSTNGRHRRYSFNSPAVTTLLTEELTIIGTDPAFDAAFERTRELIGARS